MSDILNGIHLYPTWIYLSKDKSKIIISRQSIMPDILDTVDGEQYDAPIILPILKEFLDLLDNLTNEKYPYLVVLKRE